MSTPTNSRQFPQVFPLEIRRKIYGLVLSPLGGHVYLNEVPFIVTQEAFSYAGVRQVVGALTSENAAEGETESEPFVVNQEAFSYVGVRPVNAPLTFQIVTEGMEHHEPGACISLAFLRTCRFIYEDCKDMIWDFSTVAVDNLFSATIPIYNPPITSGEGGTRRPIHDGMALKIKSVEMEIHFVSEHGTSETKRPWDVILDDRLGELERWARDGQLQYVELTLIDSNPEGYEDEWEDHANFIEIMLNRQGMDSDAPELYAPGSYQKHLEVLRAATAPGTYLSKIQRKLVIEMRPEAEESECCAGCGSTEYDRSLGPECDGTVKRKTYDQGPISLWYMRDELDDPNEVLREMNEAWGGCLIFNRQLACEDGMIKNRIFVDKTAVDEEG